MALFLLESSFSKWCLCYYSKCKFYTKGVLSVVVVGLVWKSMSWGLIIALGSWLALVTVPDLKDTILLVPNPLFTMRVL